MRTTCIILLLALSSTSYAQNYWQQAVDYKMEVDIDVKTFKYSGEQELLYTNNSPDSLKKVFYHSTSTPFSRGAKWHVRSKTERTKTPDSC